MAKKIINKRAIAILLTVVMLFNGFQIVSAAAESNDFALVENYADTYYKQDGSVGTASDWEIHLSKTAIPTTQDNVFDITLKVETKDTVAQITGTTDGAVVLVLDVSSSMNKGTGTCIKCGESQNHSSHRGNRSTCVYKDVTHLELLKDAVESFLDSYVEDAAAGDKRMVAVVKFATNADTVLSWIDVNNESNLNMVKNAVKNMDSTTGTNIEAGLVLGRNLLKLDAVKNIPLSNQSLILFSDGSPTSAVGNVNNTSVVQVTAGNGGMYGGGTSDDLPEILAAVEAKKMAVAYNTDAKLLKNVFGAENVITSNVNSLVLDLAAQAGGIVTTKTNVSTITDPMGTGVSMVTVTTNYNAETKNWDLSKFVPVVANGVTTYTITYRVEIDPMAVQQDAEFPGYTVLTPANGETTLNYTYGDNAASVKVDFNEPGIRGVRSFTVRYAYEGNVPEGAPALPAAQTYKAGAAVKVAGVPALKNYTFSGWSESDFTMPAEDVVIVGSWTENAKYTYAVNYYANFGQNEAKADAENITNTYATAHNIAVDVNTFVRPNYTFVGWNTEADGSGKTYAADSIVALTAENNTENLYAQWVENTKYAYSVIYNANFGINETLEDAENVSGVYATEYTISVDANSFSRANYTFIGWATEPKGEVVYNAGDKIHFTEGGQQILYAQWVEHSKHSYSVIYNGNGGTLADGSLSYGDSQNLQNTYSTAYDIDVDANGFVRPNYTFVGWNTKADGTGKAYAVNDVIALTAENNTETLYAQWIEDPKYDYSVIYNANFGENETKADAENASGIYENTFSIGVNENTFVRENYTFIGWNTEADGTGTAYTAGDVIALTAENNTEVLYAQWEINTYDYTVNYWVRANDEAYEIFSGELEGAPVGGTVAVGTVIDKAYLEALGLPETLADGEYTYEQFIFQGVVIAEGENVVNVYYVCLVEEEPETPEIPEDVEIPDEDVPLGGQPEDALPKTGDPIYIYMASAAASAVGLVGLLVTRRKPEEEIEEE